MVTLSMSLEHLDALESSKTSNHVIKEGKTNLGVLGVYPGTLPGYQLGTRLGTLYFREGGRGKRRNHGFSMVSPSRGESAWAYDSSLGVEYIQARGVGGVVTSLLCQTRFKESGPGFVTSLKKTLHSMLIVIELNMSRLAF